MKGQARSRVQRAMALRTHVERVNKHDRDGYGSSVASGGRVNVPPAPATSYDGSFTAQRLKDLAKLCGKGGFVVSPRTGNRVASGYAVSVYPRCDRLIGGFVSWQDLMEYLRDNWELFCRFNSVFSVSVDRATGVKRLSVCTVVKNLDRARTLARAHDQRTVVRMADGRVERVS